MEYNVVEDIKRIFVGYFKNIFDNPKWPAFNLDWEHLYQEEPMDFDPLVTPFTIEETKEVVDSFKGNKSPGPDGFTIFFY